VPVVRRVIPPGVFQDITARTSRPGHDGLAVDRILKEKFEPQRDLRLIAVAEKAAHPRRR
jgi:hypothetical protein